MTQTSPNQSFSTLVRMAGIALALLAPLHESKAEATYQTDFSGAQGTLPTDWVVHTATTLGAGMSLNGGGQLVYSQQANNGFGMAYWEGNLGAVNNGIMSDSLLETVFHWPAQNNFQSMGLLARVQEVATFTPSGYFAGIYRSDSTNRLIIAIDPDGSNFGTILGEVELTGSSAISTNTSYLLRFDLKGNDLKVGLFSADGSAEIASLNAADPQNIYFSGKAGLRARSANSANRLFAFESFGATAIPEPTTALHVLGGTIVGLFVCRRKVKTWWNNVR